MRGRVIVGGVVTSAAVLVIGWQLGGQPVSTGQQPTTSSGTSTGSGTGSSSGAGSSSSAGSSSTSGSSSSSVAGTFVGDVSQTQFGPVQVEIVVADGRITDVTALQLTDRDGRSVQISQQAAPILRQEALQAQSAAIQAVSGATYTSAGYTTSLQSAIDKAGR